MKKELPDGWKSIKLKDIATEFISGGTPSTSDSRYWNGTIPWTRSASLLTDTLESGEKKITELGLSESSTNIVSKNNVLIATRVSIGRSAVNLIDVAISQDLTGIIIDKSKIDPYYLVKFLHSSQVINHFEIFARGTTIKGLQRRDIEELIIPLPPLETQRQIVAILEKAENIRRLRKESDALTRRLLQSVFLEMFGDPVTNPMGWEVFSFNDFLDDITYGLTIRPTYHKDGIPLISAKEIRNGYLDINNAQKISIEAYENLSNKCKPNLGDFLFSKTGAIGHCVEIRTSEKIAISQNVSRLTFKKGRLNNHYILYYLRTPYIQKIAQNSSKGNAVKDLQLGDIKKFPFLCPPIELQLKFALIITRIEKEMELNSKIKIQKNYLFDALISKAFTGELVA